MKTAAETRVRVRYAETDQMGVVYYANYLVWMEVGRVELCKACGFNYRDMETEDGILLAVAEANCRYARPARFDDEVMVKTWISERAGSRMAVFGYEMRLAAEWPESGYRLSPATFSSRAGCRPARLPAKYLQFFGISRSRP